MDPISLSMLLGGTLLSAGGGILSRNDALSNATAQANARNASLAKNNAILNGFTAANENTLQGVLDNYAPGTQTTKLADAQAKRTSTNLTAMSPADISATSFASDANASPASKADLAKRTLALHDMATSRAKAMGTLGGYGDTWTNNALVNAQGNRDISVTNNYAEGRKALIGPEGDMAAAAAYKPPSIWGTIMSGVGNAMAGAGGASLGVPAKGSGAPLTWVNGINYDASGNPIPTPTYN